MKNYISEMKKVYNNKLYVFLLTLTALCGYGFKIVHPTMGIDDTPYAYYFEEGLAAVVGRWVLFVLNKIVHISDFAPFVTDCVAVLILMLAVTVWGTLFYSILGERIPRWGYWLFSCIFLSCPLIAEVFTYYLHNGIAIGYLACGVSLCLLRDGLNAVTQKATKRAVSRLIGAMAAMVVAMGCYESFMIVWLVGVLMLLLAERLAGGGKKVFLKLVCAGVTAAVAMVVRSLVIELVIAVFELQELRDEAVLRSVTELLGWMFEPGAGAEFAMILKRLFVMYGVFGYVYYPIKVFVITAVVICVFGIWRSIRQKDVWIVLLTVGVFVASFLLAVVEGKATLYRSAQFVPVICAFGMLMATYAVSGFVGSPVKNAGGAGKLLRLRSAVAKVTGAVFGVVAASVLWNQCTDLNKWFYVDYNKYQYTKEYMCRVGDALERDFDLSKPVVFTGEWDNPESIVKDAYVAIGSEDFFKLKRVTDMVDEHLLEKFYRSHGVWVAQTPSLSVVSWGKYAFETDEELVRFMAHHGYEIKPLLDTTCYEAAEEYALDMPSFPQEGSIEDVGNYIIVHF